MQLLDIPGVWEVQGCTFDVEYVGETSNHELFCCHLLITCYWMPTVQAYVQPRLQAAVREQRKKAWNTLFVHAQFPEDF